MKFYDELDFIIPKNAVIKKPLKESGL